MTLYNDRRAATIRELPESTNIFSSDNPNRIIVGAPRPIQVQQKPVTETTTPTNMR